MTTTYPTWIFDGSEIPDPFGYGERAVRALKELKHPLSKLPGNAFELAPWQERIVRAIYGPRDNQGNRIISRVTMMLPRGSRKTSLGAGLALLHLIGPEREPLGEVYCVAASVSQAKIAFNEADEIVKALKPSPKKLKRRPSYKELRHHSGASMKVLAAEGDRQQGLTPKFVLFDEIHIWPNRRQYDAMDNGLNKTDHTLGVIITTAGRGQTNIGWEQIEYARQVARGEIDDPHTLPILFETEPDADWRDEEVWKRANPGLEYGFPSLTGLRRAAKRAEGNPANIAAFKQFHLNVWMEGTGDPWLDMDIYDEGGQGPIDLSEREGEKAWLGVDLSNIDDLTCVSIALRDDDGGYTVVPFTFAPNGTLSKRQDRGDAPYVVWRDQGYLTATEGDATDFRAVEACIRDLCDRFDVQEIAFDRWNAERMMMELQDDGFPALGHGQGFRDMSEPSKLFGRTVLERKLRHGGHPILRWCVSNVRIESDGAGNIKPHKGKSTDKIDPVVASVMALGRAAAREETSIYDDIEKRPNGLLVF